MTAPQQSAAQTEQYATAQAVITAAVAAYVLSFASNFAAPALPLSRWIELLRLLYPEIARQREQSARLARSFYDSQRELFVPGLPTNAQDLEPYQFDWFVQAMEPVRQQMSVENSTQGAVASMSLRAVREVENAGRRQIIHAVENDTQLTEYITAPPKEREKLRFPDDVRNELLAILAGETPGAETRTSWGGAQVASGPRKPRYETANDVQGWARVATGDETCAWCLMLVSRGPIYMGADTAGLSQDVSETAYVRMYNKYDLETYGEKIVEEGLFDEWHIGCDCIVVPVFKTNNWFGQDAAKRALDLWNDATKAAEKELEANPGKKYYSRKGPDRGPNKGKPGWYPTTLNREAQNQLRKMIDAGEITSQEWAALSAA
jgi:hypothetical protein